MTLVTPIYSFPYPENTDPPDGPSQIHSLALAVENLLSPIAAGARTASVYTANGTLASSVYPQAKAYLIYGVNGGGGSGGAAATTANSSGSGSGGGGAFGIKIVVNTGLTYPLQVNVGAGGTAGATTPTAGGKGGQSSVKDNNGAGATLWTPGVQATNQGGASGAAGTAIGAAGVAGFDASVTSSVADFVSLGSGGGNAYRIDATHVMGANGGSSVLGGSGSANSNQTGQGTAGEPYGGGAASSTSGGTSAAQAGVAGSAGIVYIIPLY